MWHELAHDLFNYKHYDIELMMTSVPEYVGQSDLNRVVNELAKDLLDNQNKWNVSLNTDKMSGKKKEEGKQYSERLGW